MPVKASSMIWSAAPKRIQALRTARIPEEILTFGQDAADLAGLIAGGLARVGRPMGRCDPIFPAFAIKNGLELVTGSLNRSIIPEPVPVEGTSAIVQTLLMLRLDLRSVMLRGA
jgi:hypothetical protein